MDLEISTTVGWTIIGSLGQISRSLQVVDPDQVRDDVLTAQLTNR